MPKVREKPEVAQKIVNTPRRLTPIQQTKQRRIRMSPMKTKSVVTSKKMQLIKKVFARRTPHPRSPSRETKQLLATGKSPNCFSFKNEFLHTPYVLKPVLQKRTAIAYEAVSKMIHLSHDDIQERMIRNQIGKKRKYPKRDGSYLDRHYDDLVRKQQESLGDKETNETILFETKNMPKTVIRQNADSSIYIRIQDLVICEYPPSVTVNMMSKKMVESFLAPRSKPDFNSNPFYQKLAALTINRVRERRLLKDRRQSALQFEAEQ